MLSSSSTTSDQDPPPPKTRETIPECRAGSRWRTVGQQRVYNRRLLEALRGPQPQRRPRSARAIKEAADSALAMTARGQSRWSRAILASRRRRVMLKAGGKVRRRKPREPRKNPSAGAEPAGGERRRVRERLGRLGRLVPGCGGGRVGAGGLLEETADYVAALEMQIRALRALAEALPAAALTSRTAGPTSHAEEEEEARE